MDALKDKVEVLLTLAEKYQPRTVKTPDTGRAIQIVNEMKELDLAVDELKKETEKHKKKLEKELASHKRMMDKLFAVLEQTPTTNHQTANHGYKTWQLKWWKIWREQRREGQTWDGETLRQSVKCYSVPTWEKKQESLISAGILTLETDNSLTVNVLPESLLQEVSE